MKKEEGRRKKEEKETMLFGSSTQLPITNS
jgi:hypothetical protein